jgi:hypothetical protein
MTFAAIITLWPQGAPRKPVDSFRGAAGTQNDSGDSLQRPGGRLLLTEEGLASFDWRRVVALLARPGTLVDPTSFQNYKPGGAQENMPGALFWRLCRMKQNIRELKRQVAGEKLKQDRQ